MNSRVDLTVNRDFRYDNEEFPNNISSVPIKINNSLTRFLIGASGFAEIDTNDMLEMHTNIDPRKRKEIQIARNGNVYIEKLRKDFNTCNRCGVKIIQEGLCDKCSSIIFEIKDQRDILKREKIESFKRLE